MGVGVVGDFVALGDDPPRSRRVPPDHAADREEGRLRLVALEDREDLPGVDARPVVEGKRHLAAGRGAPSNHLSVAARAADRVDRTDPVASQAVGRQGEAAFHSLLALAIGEQRPPAVLPRTESGLAGGKGDDHPVRCRPGHRGPNGRLFGHHPGFGHEAEADHPSRVLLAADAESPRLPPREPVEFGAEIGSPGVGKVGKAPQAGQGDLGPGDQLYDQHAALLGHLGALDRILARPVDPEDPEG